ncbi:hypothetical protein DV735_g1946, partial [Chaetothyriales sp. CBS 134920]
MASTTAAAPINAKLEELARSLIPLGTATATATTPAKTRRHVDHFVRAAKHHHYARTNQFDVHQRLIGLEEKFQVLNHDDLSDALRQRRLMLARHDHDHAQKHWLPEALHLLLDLSENPVERGGGEAEIMANLARLDRTVAVIPVLNIWQQPDFTGYDSDEDVMMTTESRASHSPTPSQKGVKPAVLVGQQTADIFDHDNRDMLKLAADLKQSKLDSNGDSIAMTEIQAIREVLFMAQGFPTALFHPRGSSNFAPDINHRLAHLHDSSFHSILQAVVQCSAPAHQIRRWLQHDHSSPLMQALQSSVQELLDGFDQAMNGFHQRLLDRAGGGGVASLLAVVDSIRKQAAALVTVRNLLVLVHGRSAIDCLDAIHNSVASAQIANNPQGFRALLRIFQTVFKKYAESLETWVSDGALEQDDNDSRGFFVSRAEDHQHDKSALWSAWFTLSRSEANKPPVFLANLVTRILVAGKARVFLRLLSRATPSTSGRSVPALDTIIDHVCASTTSSIVPFAPTLSSCLDAWLASHLNASTTPLQNILHIRLNLKATLSAMSNLYFSSPSAGYPTNAVDSHIFRALDRASPSWNDSFRLTDILASSFSQIPDFDVSRISISSKPVSRSDLRAARRSVTVLSNLDISYTLPWTIANMLTPSRTNPSYQRISLFLRQMRRAQYCLECHALPALQSSHQGDHGLRSSVRVSGGRLIRPLRITEGVFLFLHTITTTLYAYMTDCVIGPLTHRFHTQIIGQGDEAAQMIDDMIYLHHLYVHSLEIACLTALTKNISLVRATIIEILDICLAFSLGIARSCDRDDRQEDDKERTCGFEDGLGRGQE